MTLTAELQQIGESFSGKIGLWARSLVTGEVVTSGAAGETFPSASVIKLPVLYELFRQAGEGRFRLEETRVLTDGDKVPGAGVLQHLSPGLTLPIMDLAALMMIVSDNTASNMCIDLVGPEQVRRSMADLGLPGLQLHNRFYRAVPGGPVNQAVPEQLGQLLDRIVRAEVLTPEACSRILSIMKQVQNPMTPRYFPDDEPPAELAAKTGAIQGCRHEVAAIFKGGRGFVTAIMTRDCQDLRYHPDNEGELVVARLAAALYRYFLKV